MEVPVRVTPTTVVLSATGRAGVEEVWTALVTPDCWPRWAPHIREVRYPLPRLVAGTSGKVLGPGLAAIDFEVLSVEEQARTWTWRVSMGPVRIVMAHAALPEASGSRVRLTVRGWHAVALGYAPLALWALRRLADTAPGG